MRRQELIGAIHAASAATVIGSSVAASSLIVNYPVLTSQAVRYAMASVAMAGLLRWRGQPIPRLAGRDLGRVIAMALTGLIGFNLCLLAALRLADPAAIGVVIGCTPVVLALAGPLARGQPPRGRVLTAALIVTAGAAIVQGSGTTTALGLILAIGALAGEAALSLLGAPVLPRLGPLVLSTYVCAAAGAVLFGAAIVVDGPRALLAVTPAQALAICYLALPVTVGGFLAWFSGLSRLGVERTGLFAGIIPISALITTAVVGMGSLTPLRALGACLVGAGVAVGVMNRRKGRG